MTRDARRRAGWAGVVLGLAAAYLVLRTYADRSRSMEAVLGIGHGDAAWHGAVAASVIGLRLLAWGAIGGALVALPVEELLLRRRRRAAVGAAEAGTDRRPPGGEAVPPGTPSPT